jgi:myo-inositol 2-dehydrogenase / D-chiro-inositol 1-dehydrogenase
MSAVRVGLIGAGVMGRIHALHLSHEISGARLVAVADLDLAKALRCAEEFGANGAFADYPEMLADASIDAVVICTPGKTHAEIIEAAAKAGKHIFCEKPIDWDLRAVDRALAAVDTAGVKLQIGFQRRFDGAFRQARDAVVSGGIGPPHILHLISRDPASPYAGHKAEGDLYFDSTIHDLDMVRFLMGEEVDSVISFGTATGLAEDGEGDDPDTAVTLLRLRSGAIASLVNSRRSSRYDQRAEMFGPGGVVCVENQPAVAPPETDYDIPFYAQRYRDSYAAEISAFVGCVRSDRQPEVNGNDGRAALVLALAALRSYREGRPVGVKEIG